jgi:hypothetical protein
VHNAWQPCAHSTAAAARRSAPPAAVHNAWQPCTRWAATCSCARGGRHLPATAGRGRASVARALGRWRQDGGAGRFACTAKMRPQRHECTQPVDVAEHRQNHRRERLRQRVVPLSQLCRHLGGGWVGGIWPPMRHCGSSLDRPRHQLLAYACRARCCNHRAVFAGWWRRWHRWCCRRARARLVRGSDDLRQAYLARLPYSMPPTAHLRLRNAQCGMQRKCQYLQLSTPHAHEQMSSATERVSAGRMKRQISLCPFAGEFSAVLLQSALQDQDTDARPGH